MCIFSETIKCISLIPHQNIVSQIEHEKKLYRQNDIGTLLPVFFPLKSFIEKESIPGLEFSNLCGFFSNAKTVHISKMEVKKNTVFRELIIKSGEQSFSLEDKQFFAKELCKESGLLKLGTFFYARNLDNNINNMQEINTTENQITLRVFKLAVLTLSIKQTATQNIQLEWTIETEKWIKKT